MEKPATVLAMIVCMAALTAAQTSSGGIPPCAMELVPCFNYLNSTTTPPSTCCNPIKQVITKEKACLCSIYNNRGLIEAFHINVTQALNLISLCHVNADPNLCKAEAPSPSSSSVSSESTPASPDRAVGDGSEQHDEAADMMEREVVNEVHYKLTLSTLIPTNLEFSLVRGMEYCCLNFSIVDD